MANIHDPRVKADILGRLEGLGPDSPRQWGRMTAHQAICHLSDAFEWAAGRRSATPVKGPALPVFVIKLVGLYLPMSWPKGSPTMPEADQLKGGTPPGDFDRDRARLAELTEEFATAPKGTERPFHPIFKTMTRAQWGRWAYRHMDHHLTQFGV